MGMFQTRGSNERYGVIESSIQRSAAAAGSSQTDATLIGANVSNISGATGSNGVVLRKGKNTPYAGVIYSSAATNALLVYPPVGGTINGGSVNASVSVAARKPAIFWMIAGTGLDFIMNLGA